MASFAGLDLVQTWLAKTTEIESSSKLGSQLVTIVRLILSRL